MNKTGMLALTPYEQTIFLDADTLPVARFPELWPEGDEVRLTQFTTWTTKTGKIIRRVEQWRKAAPELVERQLSYEYPGLNTGVIGFPDSAGPFFKAWAELTAKNICFMCDELAAQLMFLDFPHLVLDDRWNCSPIYSWEVKPGEDPEGQGTRRADARIYHGHGFKFTKSPWGRRLWFPWLRKALDFNVAKMASWFPGADAKVKGFLRDPARYSGTAEELAALIGEEAAA
jgi:hypothetical protein